MACNWILQFKTTCGYCQKPLRKGSTVNRVRETGKFACRSCDRLLSKGQQPVVPESPAQALIDRARRIMHLRETKDELDEIIQRLRTEFASERAAQQFLAGYFELRRNEAYVCMALRHDGHCNACSTRVQRGNVAVWDRFAHRIWCLECAPG